MFSLFASQEKKMRRNAANWLELAGKVWHYRRDTLTEREAAEMNARRDELRQLVKERAPAPKLKLAIESLEGVLKRMGGPIYPKTSLTENVEFFLVAAIVILGIRTYFVQPFKIPTNSMKPTYYGMTAADFPPGTPAPGLLDRAFRLVAFGAQPRDVIAPRGGQVTAQFFADTGAMACTIKSARSWLIFPAQVREYTFYVDGAPVTVQVPLDFDEYDDVVRKTFFGGDEGFKRAIDQQAQGGQLTESWIRADEASTDMKRTFVLSLNRTVRKGDPILRFDVMAGDELFVDRFSYNFVRPKVGQGFVFRTDNIPEIGKQDYYIKRLIGVPGDVIEIRTPALYRNGRPITGSPIFQLESSKTPPYAGYGSGDLIPGGAYLYPGKTLTVPPHSFFAMGDNSYNSSDGRVWGFVPAKDAIGHPLFIYYPFTRRWGLAK